MGVMKSGFFKYTLSLVCFVSLLAAADSLNVFGGKWDITTPASDWAVADNLLQLKVSSEPPAGQPRKPTHIALLDSKPYSKVTVEADVKRNGRSVIIVWGWQNDSHYNYAHISSDTAVAQNVHNGMFHVFGGERVRMSSLEGPGSLATQDWTPRELKLVLRDGRIRPLLCGSEWQAQSESGCGGCSLRWGRCRAGVV